MLQNSPGVLDTLTMVYPFRNVTNAKLHQKQSVWSTFGSACRFCLQLPNRYIVTDNINKEKGSIIRTFLMSTIFDYI